MTTQTLEECIEWIDARIVDSNMSRDKFIAIRARLLAAQKMHDLLTSAYSGFMPGSDHHVEWEKERQAVMKEWEEATCK